MTLSRLLSMSSNTKHNALTKEGLHFRRWRSRGRRRRRRRRVRRRRRKGRRKGRGKGGGPAEFEGVGMAEEARGVVRVGLIQHAHIQGFLQSSINKFDKQKKHKSQLRMATISSTK